MIRTTTTLLLAVAGLFCCGCGGAQDVTDSGCPTLPTPPALPDCQPGDALAIPVMVLTGSLTAEIPLDADYFLTSYPEPNSASTILTHWGAHSSRTIDSTSGQFGFTFLQPPVAGDRLTTEKFGAKFVDASIMAVTVGSTWEVLDETGHFDLAFSDVCLGAIPTDGSQRQIVAHGTLQATLVDSRSLDPDAGVVEASIIF